MYGYYKNILISLEQKSLPKGVSKQNAFDASINRWLQQVGLGYGESTTSLQLVEEQPLSK